MRYQNYLRSAEKIITAYRFETPLPVFLRNHYRANRQMGSTDRRTIGGLVYAYFRTGALFNQLSREERLTIAWFLCHRESTPLLNALRPAWDAEAGLPAEDKLRLLESEYGPLDPLKLFPLHGHLSGPVNARELAFSMLRQPRLFIRLRDRAAAIKDTLAAAKVSFRQESGTCLSLDNSTPVAELLKSFRGDFEVQDLSSQQTGEFFQAGAGQKWWDTCAGSGGKSLLLHALEPDVALHVSDNRPSVLNNLKKRFRAAGISKYELEAADLLRKGPSWGVSSFDGIILDAPCSGSGTWGRSPEMMAAFGEASISRFARLQQRLIAETLPYLKPGCPLVYITCSVFREENEQVIAAACRSGELELSRQEVLKGYLREADTMFVARLLKK